VQVPRALAPVIKGAGESRQRKTAHIGGTGVAGKIRHDDLNVIGECSNGQEAQDAIQQHKPDLVFLDIQMPLLNGIVLLRALPPDETPYTIFLMAFDEYVMQAVEVHAIAYLEAH
jgi:two-component system LytT family response regulator